MTSISIMSAFHLVVFGAILTSVATFNFRRFPRSAGVFLLLGLAMSASVLVNWDSYENPSKVLLKSRYLIIGVLAIIPFDFYFNTYLSPTERVPKLQKTLFLFLLAANLASASGLLGYWTGFNPLRPGVFEGDRNVGTFGKVMPYAHCVSWQSLFLVSLWTQRGRLNLGRLFPSWYLVFSIVLSLECLFATHTRGAMLAWFVGCLFINRKIAFSGLLFFVLSSAAAHYISDTFASKHIIRSGSNEERLGSWLGAYEAFKKRPVLGFGYMNYFSVSKQIKREHNLPAPEFQGDAHNDFLELMASLGLVGFSVFVAWILMWIREVYKRSKLDRAFVYPFIIAFLVSGLTQVTLATSECLFFLTAFYAFSVVLASPEKGMAKPLVTSKYSG